MEPPVLVKLEKEIELEETLLRNQDPPPAVKTFSVCCQHGGLYQPGVGWPSRFYSVCYLFSLLFVPFFAYDYLRGHTFSTSFLSLSFHTAS